MKTIPPSQSARATIGALALSALIMIAGALALPSNIFGYGSTTPQAAVFTGSNSRVAYATNSGFATNAATASNSITSSNATSASNALTANYATSAGSALTATNATTASNALTASNVSVNTTTSNTVYFSIHSAPVIGVTNSKPYVGSVIFAPGTGYVSDSSPHFTQGGCLTATKAFADSFRTGSSDGKASVDHKGRAKFFSLVTTSNARIEGALYAGSSGSANYPSPSVGLIAGKNIYLDSGAITSSTNGSGTLTVNVLDSSATQTTTNGSTAGTVVCSMPFQGTSYKKAIFFLNGFHGSVTYTFPVAFTGANTLIVGGTLSADATPSASSVTISTSTNTTGAFSVDGF